MRRKDKEITDRAVIDQVLEEAQVCRIALCDDGKPYIVPMNFGFEEGCLYLHSAFEGKKIDIMRKNNNVCFEVDAGCESVEDDSPCEWSMKYYSVIGFGKAQILEDSGQKAKGLDVIVKKHTGKPYGDYAEETLNRLVVIRVEIESITGKMSKG